MLPHGMSQSILKYFTARLHSSLPNPNGPLSTRISPAAISSANVTGFAKRGLIHAYNFSTLKACN